MNRTTWITVVLLLVAGLGYLLLGTDPAPTRPGQDDREPASGPEAASAQPGEQARTVAEAPEMTETTRTALAAGAEAGGAPAGTASAAPASLQVRLVDPKGRPVRDVEVFLESRDRSGFGSAGIVAIEFGDQEEGKDGPEQARTGTRPDRDGWVRFGDIEAGPGQSLEIEGSYWIRRKMRVAPLQPGERRDLGELALSPGVRLTGTVRDAQGRPVEGATVEIAQDGDRIGFNLAGGKVAETTSSEKGAYSLPGLAPGRFRLRAESPGLVDASQVIELEAAPRDQSADLQLGAGGRVTGRVVDVGGNPLPGARVAIAPADGLAVLHWRRERVLREGTEVGADGRFDLRGLPPTGRHRLLATAEGYATERSATLKDGSELQLSLAPTRELVGRVVDSAGRPVAGAAVRLEPFGSSSGLMMFRRDSDTSDEDGGFRFEGVKVGDYRLTARGPAGEALLEPVTVGERNQPVELKLRGGDALIVSVKNAQGLPLREAEISLRGTGGDNDFGGGDGGFRVIRGDGGGRRSGKTDANGEIRFLGLTVGPYQLEAEAEGCAGTRQELQRSGEEEQRVELVLHPACGLLVRVVDTLGVPVPGADLELRSTDPGSSFNPSPRRADDWGIAVWDELEPGSYSVHQGSSRQVMQFSDGDMAVSFGNEGETAASAPPSLVVELAAGGTADETLVIASKALLRVRVSRFGEPVAGATVKLRPPDEEDSGPFGGSNEQSAKTDGEGWASLPPCEAGGYTLSARAAQQNPATTMEVELGSGLREIQVALASGEVSGVVLGPEGPIGNARVHIIRGAGGELGAVQGMVMMSVAMGGDDDELAIETMDFLPGQTSLNTAADGGFRFRDVPAGAWHLRIDATGYSRFQSEDIHLEEGARVDLGLLELSGAGTLRGGVLGLPEPDPDGFSMNMIQLLDPDGESVKFSIVRPNGRYAFRDVPPGTYTLEIEVGGETHRSDPVAVSAGPPTDFDFQL